MPTLENVSSLAPATGRLQQAIDEASAAGGGRVLVPAGVHRTGSLQLRSDIELHLEAGATLQLVPEPELYPPVTARWEGAPVDVHRPGLYASGARNVAITGFGTIDGGGQAWWERSREITGVVISGAREPVVSSHDGDRIRLEVRGDDEHHG